MKEKIEHANNSNKSRKRNDQLSKEERLNSALLYTPEIITWMDQTNSTDD